VASKTHTGIRLRHSRSCTENAGGRCNCQPSAEAWVFDRRSGKKIRRTFSGPGALAAAKGWRADAEAARRRGKLIAPTKKTLEQAADEWLKGALASPPTILNRSGRPYKPSVLRGYEHDLREYVLEDLGHLKLHDVRRGDLQALVDRLVGEGHSASKVRNVLNAVRVLFRHAVEREEVSVNPTSGLRLPNNVGKRERAASPQEAAELLAALPEDLRALYATAFYGGLRRGELRALRWEDVDLALGVIRVRRSYDDYAGEIEPKSAKGSRTVPLSALLRDYLVEHKARTGRDGSALVFGRTPADPFTPTHIRDRALSAWANENERRTEEAEEQGTKPTLLVAIGLHEARHTFVSLMHNAGLSLERIGDYVGHASTYMTDRYRHLLEGHEAEAARLLDEYLARADTRGRLEQLDNAA
jgi:integrase